MSENQLNLKAWRKSKGWRQEDLADKLKEPRPTYQSWETGRTPSIPPDVQEKIRKMGYKGPWPAEESQEAPATAEKPLTRDDFIKAIGGLESRLKDLEGVVEDLAEGLYAAIPSMPPRSRRAGRSE